MKQQVFGNIQEINCGFFVIYNVKWYYLISSKNMFDCWASQRSLCCEDVKLLEFRNGPHDVDPLTCTSCTVHISGGRHS